jgi:hypothetical protein
MAEALHRWRREEDVVDDITCFVVFLNFSDAPIVTAAVAGDAVGVPSREPLVPVLNPMMEAVRVSSSVPSAVAVKPQFLPRPPASSASANRSVTASEGAHEAGAVVMASSAASTPFRPDQDASQLLASPTSPDASRLEPSLI